MLHSLLNASLLPIELLHMILKYQPARAASIALLRSQLLTVV
jgi:hypothetical protein